MPVTFEDGRATFTGECVIEEAEGLLAWLYEHPEGLVDVTACTHLHTAILQALLFCFPHQAGPPQDPFLARWLWPLLTKSRTGQV